LGPLVHIRDRFNGDHIGTITELLDLYSRMTKIYNKPNLPCLRPRLTETAISPETTETGTIETDRDRDGPRPRPTKTEPESLGFVSGSVHP